MRNLFLFPLMVLFAITNARSQTYGLGNSDPAVFSQFRIPETNLHSFQTGASLWTDYGERYDTAYTYSESYFSNATQMEVGPQYYMLKETDDLRFSLNADVEGSYYNQFERTKSPTDTATLNQAFQKDAGLQLELSSSYRNYGTNENIFYSISSNLEANLDDQYQNASVPSGEEYTGSKYQSYDVSFGFGIGKIRNVTPVVSAIRFQERMKQLNLIDSDLSEKAIEDLAEEFYRAGYYSQVHDRPGKFFWQDVQKALAGDGVSLTGLNEYAYSYLSEVPGELRFTRNEGAVAGINLELSYANSYYAHGYPVINEQFYTLGNLYAQYSHQLNLNSQIALNISLSGGPDVIKNSAIRQEYTGTGNVNYSYELTDRIVTTITNTFNLMFFNSLNQEKYLRDNLTASLNYFVEDHISISGSYNWALFREVNYNGFSIYNESDNFINIGLTYYIDRGFIYK